MTTCQELRDIVSDERLDRRKTRSSTAEAPADIPDPNLQRRKTWQKLRGRTCLAHLENRSVWRDERWHCSALHESFLYIQRRLQLWIILDEEILRWNVLVNQMIVNRLRSKWNRSNGWVVRHLKRSDWSRIVVSVLFWINWNMKFPIRDREDNSHP